MQPVSRTAQWTAAIRAIERDQAREALFRDDLAEHLAMPDGFDLLKRYHAGGVQDFVAIRTRFFDDVCIENTCSSKPLLQIVMVAAGMDTRAYRLRWPNRARVFELDHETLLSEKARRLDKCGAVQNVTVIPLAVDLANSWKDHLLDSEFDANAPTLWLVEGLLFFLTQDQVDALLRTLHSISAPGTRLVTDMTSEALLRSPLSRPFLQKLCDDGVPWQFGTDDPEVFLAERGWRATAVKQPGEVGAGEGRWPYKTHPRGVKGVARNWLVLADAITDSVWGK